MTLVKVDHIRSLIKGLKHDAVLDITNEAITIFEPPVIRNKKLDVKRIYELHERGIGSSDIAKKLYTSKQAVNYWLEKLKPEDSK